MAELLAMAHDGAPLPTNNTTLIPILLPTLCNTEMSDSAQRASDSAVILGPWGGAGGNAFDDGWNNSGVSRVTIYYTEIVRGLEVVYGNGSTKLHGSRVGTAHQIQFNPATGALQALTDISITVAPDSGYFSGDPNNIGVVAVGLSSSAVTHFPSGRNGRIVRPQILGFFGSAGTNIDRLGVYVSNVRRHT